MKNEMDDAHMKAYQTVWEFWMRRMTVGEEVFLVVRELTASRQYATWGDFLHAWDCCTNSQIHTRDLTIGHFLRGQQAGETIKWISRGRYKFIKPRPAVPMYLRASQAHARGIKWGKYAIYLHV